MTTFSQRDQGQECDRDLFATFTNVVIAFLNMDEANDPVLLMQYADVLQNKDKNGSFSFYSLFLSFLPSFL